MSNDDDMKFEEIPMEDASFHALPEETPPAGAEPPPSDPSPTPPLDAPDPAKVPPGMRRPPGLKPRPGTAPRISAAPRPAGSPRPVAALRPPPGSKMAKYLVIAILVLIPALIAVGFAMGTWNKLLIQAGLMAKPTPTPKPAPAAHYDLDDEFKQAGDIVTKADAFVSGELKAFEDKYATAKPAIEEIKALLNQCDLASGPLMGAAETIAKVRGESNKPPGNRMTSITTADASELDRRAAALKDRLARSYSAWKKVQVELTPHVDLGTSVEADPLTISSMSPWADLPAGTWWRARKTDAKAKVETYEDTIIESVEAGVLKGRIIAFGGGKREEVALEMPAVDAAAKIGAEEKLEVGGKPYKVQVAEMTGPGGPVKLWICREAIALNFVPLKGSSAAADFKVTSIGAEDLNVGGRLVNCVVVDVETKVNESTLRRREWYSKSVPGWVVKRESSESTFEVIQFGTAADPRDLFPGEAKPTPTPIPTETPKPTPTPTASATPPPPDPKVIAQAKLDEGSALLAEATPLFKEVATAMSDLPDDKEKLKALATKGAIAVEKMDAAVGKYLEGRDLAPDPAAVDKRIAGIGKLKAKLADYLEQIQARLK